MARRLAEGGSSDEGDFEVDLYGTRWVGEAKARASLSVQTTLAKAREKAKGHPVLLVWKRLVRVEGKAYRQPVGKEGTVVILSWNDFNRLLEDTYKAGQASPTTKEDT